MIRLLRACLLAGWFPFAVHAAPLRDGITFSSGPEPIPVRSATTQRLAYELHLANHADVPLVLERIEVFDAASSVPLASLTADELQGALRLAGSARGEAPTRTLPPGRVAVAYLDISLDAARTMPKALRHRLAWLRDGAPVALEGADTRVSSRTAVVLGAPLGGGDWVALYDPAMARGHRRVAFAIDGMLRIPARHAIDWMRVDDAGRLSQGDEQVLVNWYGYGADVLAVADATVVALRDSIAEPARLGSATRHPLEDASGNYVSLDLGDGRYAHYEHLLPGSVRVRVGERVRRGAPIARLGFTGDATGPHLHLHVSDGATPLAGEGVPFVLDAYTAIGAYASMAALGQPYTPEPGARARTNDLPLPAAVVRFEARDQRDGGAPHAGARAKLKD
ncbi:MAG: peptidoglycan DD-metalloendopeptidase family protein [Dokdonella sp.]|uniref:peptidoglycan DD-metalloendopeptidase family protein n=1 Tax=Dokdonella sp. TaxID=2291710 RepID=UPI003F820DA7